MIGVIYSLDLVQSWDACIKCVDDLTVLESLLNVVVDDIYAFTVNNNMR